MISREVSIPVDSSQMRAYLARPQEESGPHPAVIVLPEVFGFTPEVRRVTDLLASAGYVGLAIDYYHRTSPGLNAPYTEDGSKTAFEAAAKVTARDLTRDIAAAARWLADQPFVRDGNVATWGFGFGATAAFVASSLAQLRGAVCFYPGNVASPMPGGGEAPLEHAAEAAVPLLFIYGAKDYYVSRFEMDRIADTLRAAGKNVRMQSYPDVGHSYFRHGRPEAIAEQQRYSDEAVAQAVADSWDLVRQFLKEIFSPPGSRASVTGDIRTGRTQSVRS